jgi:hypothetical protein
MVTARDSERSYINTFQLMGMLAVTCIDGAITSNSSPNIFSILNLVAKTNALKRMGLRAIQRRWLPTLGHLSAHG